MITDHWGYHTQILLTIPDFLANYGPIAKCKHKICNLRISDQ